MAESVDPPHNPKKRSAASDTGLEPINKKPTKLKLEEGEKVFTPHDDLLLKDSVISRTIFAYIAKSANFSTKFAASELQARWRELLYDPEISDQAARYFASNTEKKRRSKWTDAELKLMDRCKEPNFEGFRSLLEQNRPIFHPTRTVKLLESYGKGVMKAAEIETTGKKAAKTTATRKATGKKTKSTKDEPVVFDEEISLDKFPWTSHPDIKALLVGNKINYEVRSVPIFIGRRAANPSEQELHVNLAEEGDAGKISRHQATIDIDPATKKFTITQVGKATTAIDELDLRDQGPVTLPQHCELVFSNLHLEWIERPS